MIKHTPGPWKVSRRFDIYEDTQKPGVGGTYIGTTRGNDLLPESVNLKCAANAKLMAASPELLGLIADIYRGLHIGQGKFASSSDGEISEAINDTMCNVLGNDWLEHANNQPMED